MFTSKTFARLLLSAGLLAVAVSGIPAQGQGPRGGQQGQGQRPPMPTPQQLASLLVQRFDSTGDLALNAQELSQALVFLHENRPGGGNNQSDCQSQ